MEHVQNDFLKCLFVVTSAYCAPGTHVQKASSIIKIQTKKNYVCTKLLNIYSGYLFLIGAD